MRQITTPRTIINQGGSSGGDITPTDLGTISGTVSLNALNSIQKANLNGSLILSTPVGGSENSSIEVWLTASGANRSLDISLIKIPSDSAVSFPKTLESGKLYVVSMTKTSSFWMLRGLMGGYL